MVVAVVGRHKLTVGLAEPVGGVLEVALKVFQLRPEQLIQGAAVVARMALILHPLSKGPLEDWES